MMKGQKSLDCAKIAELRKQHDIERELENKASEKRFKALSKIHKKQSDDWTPQRLYLVRCFNNIKQRCNNPKANRYERYGGRGIKCLITYGELIKLWDRDKGWLIKQPSIDRINNDGNYEFSNCRFIPMRENIGRNKGMKKHTNQILDK